MCKFNVVHTVECKLHFPTVVGEMANLAYSEDKPVMTDLFEQAAKRAEAFLEGKTINFPYTINRLEPEIAKRLYAHVNGDCTLEESLSDLM